MVLNTCRASGAYSIHMILILKISFDKQICLHLNGLWQGGVVYHQKKRGGGGRKRAVSAQCEVRLKMAGAEPAWGKPNHRESYALLSGWATWSRFFCSFFFFFWGVRVASGAQWPTSVAAQVIWQAKKKTKFGFIQVYSSAPDLLFLTKNRALCGGHLDDSMDFFSTYIRRFRDSRGGRPLTLERTVVGSNTLCFGPFVASLFFVWRGRARLRCRFGDPLTWKVNDWTLTDRAWGDHFSPH